jgi:integrase
MEGLKLSRNVHLKAAVELALETGMRRSELLQMTWDDIDRDRQTILLPLTKNGHSRVLPLTEKARAILGRCSRDTAEVIPLSPNALRLAWDRLCKRSKVEDLHFHDLRHEAISRFFEIGLSMPEVAMMSGHRDLRMLMRYTHLSPIRLAKRLDDLSAQSVEMANLR